MIVKDYLVSNIAEKPPNIRKKRNYKPHGIVVQCTKTW